MAAVDARERITHFLNADGAVETPVGANGRFAVAQVEPPASGYALYKWEPDGSMRFEAFAAVGPLLERMSDYLALSRWRAVAKVSPIEGARVGGRSAKNTNAQFL